jgi:hypothetical protein
MVAASATLVVVSMRQQKPHQNRYFPPDFPLFLAT